MAPQSDGKLLLSFTKIAIHTHSAQNSEAFRNLITNALTQLNGMRLKNKKLKKLHQLQQIFQQKHPGRPASSTSKAHPQATHENSLFRNLAINKDHFKAIATIEEVLPPDSPIDLLEAYQDLFTILDEAWQDDLTVQDDPTVIGNLIIPDENSTRTKYHVIEDIIAKLIFIQNSAAGSPLIGDQATVRSVNNMLCHIAKSFKDRNEAINSKSDSAEKKQEMEVFQRELLRFFLSFGATCNTGISHYHCSDRLVTDTIIFYNKYVKKKSYSLDSFLKDTLERNILKILQDFRQDIIQNCCSNVLDNNEFVGGERYIKKKLNDELGLGYPAAISDAVNYEGMQWDRDHKVNEARLRFNQQYSPQAIVARLIATIKEASGNTNRKSLYMKIVDWFELRDPPKQAQEIFDLEKDEFKSEAVVELLKAFHIFN